MHVLRIIKVRSRNQKAINITYSECVFVALGIQHAMRMHHTVICGVPVCAVFLNIISQAARLFKKKCY